MQLDILIADDKDHIPGWQSNKAAKARDLAIVKVPPWPLPAYMYTLTLLCVTTVKLT